MKSRDPSQSIWADALAMLEQAGRLHRQFFQLGSQHAGGPTWEPPVDVFETDGEVAVLVALPGVAPDQVSVVVDGGALFVVGERPLPAPALSTLRRLEIPYGRFERRIDLPPGRFEIGERALVDGCLRIVLRKFS